MTELHLTKNLFCLNCGSKNHTLKECKDHIISLGIICIKNNFQNINFNNNQKLLFNYYFNNYIDQKKIGTFNFEKIHYTKNYNQYEKSIFDKNIEYCMICRRNSIGYVEFIRGKYNIKKKNYVLKLFSLMSKKELETILDNDFTTLWKNLWIIKDEDFVETQDFLNSKLKFLILKTGVKFDDSEDIINLQEIIKNVQFIWDEPEWGFPKGRREMYETDLQGAIREFCEETNLPKEHVKLLNIKPITEIYKGTNNISYKTIYYLAEYTGELDSSIKLKTRCKNENQKIEVSDIGWFNVKNSNQLIRGYQKEKKKILKYVHFSLFKFYDLYIKKNIFNQQNRNSICEM
jgi:8-oxo-dGTP pyrophosphatase MutT (NUDIX family)